MARRRPNGRAIKSNRTYTVDEAARTTGSSPVTIRRWLGKGLPAMTDRKPALILGEDLIAFLKARKPARQKCRPPECYCLKCRVPREPAFDTVEIIPINATTGNMRALCADCTTIMHKRVPLAVLPILKAEFGLTITLHCERINENA